MCETCGCNITPANKHLIQKNGKLAKTENGKLAVSVLQNLLSENDLQANHNRLHFEKNSVLAINLMSAPGAGKTSLLEATIELLKSRYRIAVIEGDLETENDANRIRAKGVTAIQICTGNACHLDAHMLHDALHQIELAHYDIVFIENVGNLVCPASFDLGHHVNVALLSVTEGDDKPAKYPVMFRAADLVLLTKVDLLAVLDDFDPVLAQRNLRNLANTAPVIQLSARRGLEITKWTDWLDNTYQDFLEGVQRGKSRRPNMQNEGILQHRYEHIHPSTNKPIPI